jgi:hypothetical protein
MPQYSFLCQACNKEFSKTLTLSEYEAVKKPSEIQSCKKSSLP